MKTTLILLMMALTVAGCKKQEKAVEHSTNPKTSLTQKSAITSTVTTTCSTSPVSYATQFCQCVQYVKRRLGYNDGTIGADTWGPKLICEGFTLQTIPANKDILIIDHKYGHGFDPTYGHVALVATATESSDKKSYILTVVNANWGSGTRTTECGCTNVTTNALTVQKTDFGKTLFLYRNPSLIKKCP